MRQHLFLENFFKGLHNKAQILRPVVNRLEKSKLLGNSKSGRVDRLESKVVGSRRLLPRMPTLYVSIIGMNKVNWGVFS